MKAKWYWEKEDDESDETYHRKKVILDINELSLAEVNTMCHEDITYDGIVEHSSYGSKQFHFNVDAPNNNLQEDNCSTLMGDENSDTNEYTGAQKLSRQDLDDKQCVLLDKFQNENMLCRLIKNLDEVSLTEDFLCLIDVLSTGEMGKENLPLILVMEVARYWRCTTTLMRFHDKSKAFWRVGVRMWHGNGLLLMSGNKNRDEVKNKETVQGYYKPSSSSSFNFVVPDVKTIQRRSHDSKRNKALCMYERVLWFDNVLMYDCKKVVRVLTGRRMLGDEDMGFWRATHCETNPQTHIRWAGNC